MTDKLITRLPGGKYEIITYTKSGKKKVKYTNKDPRKK